MGDQQATAHCCAKRRGADAPMLAQGGPTSSCAKERKSKKQEELAAERLQRENITASALLARSSALFATRSHGESSNFCCTAGWLADCSSLTRCRVPQSQLLGLKKPSEFILSRRQRKKKNRRKETKQTKHIIRKTPLCCTESFYVLVNPLDCRAASSLAPPRDRKGWTFFNSR